MTQDPLRTSTLDAAEAWVWEGGFAALMAPRLAIRSESPRADSAPDHLAYLCGNLAPYLEEMGFDCRLLENPVLARLPALLASRIEGQALPTVLIYGHGDVLWGMEGEWRAGTGPWEAALQDGRLYGRGTVDNKGQHSLNLHAIAAVLAARGALGFNVKVLIEMGEECGSPGLAEIIARHRADLAADVLIASDGPRVSATQPTIFLGARGAQEFTLRCHLREGAYHSGNWGGLLPNAGLRLAQALATITDPKGQILVEGWRPAEIAPNVRAALDAIEIERGPNDPVTDPSWGEPGLTEARQVLGWCNFEVLAFTCGRPEAPVNAIPGEARAFCQLRFVAGVDVAEIGPHLRAHLNARGFCDVTIEVHMEESFPATRTPPENPWVEIARASLTQTLGTAPALAPNFGGALPNHLFAQDLGLPTLWIPHSHPACGQHAPDEHILLSVAAEGVRLMTGLFWDIGLLAQNGAICVQSAKHAVIVD